MEHLPHASIHMPYDPLPRAYPVHPENMARQCDLSLHGPGALARFRSMGYIGGVRFESVAGTNRTHVWSKVKVSCRLPSGA